MFAILRPCQGMVSTRKSVNLFFEEKYDIKKCLLTTSGTDALEMCAMLCDLKPGDGILIGNSASLSNNHLYVLDIIKGFI